MIYLDREVIDRTSTLVRIAMRLAIPSFQKPYPFPKQSDLSLLLL
jgi:hypothetical protein